MSQEQYLAAQLESQVRRARRAADDLEDLVGTQSGMPRGLHYGAMAVSVPPPLAPAPEPRKKKSWYVENAGLLGLGIGAGAILLLVLGKKTAVAKPNPAELPEQQPIHSVPPPGPVIIEETLVEGRPVVANWSTDKKTLNTLTGFHRAKQKELGPEAISKSPQILRDSRLGDVVFFEADNNKQYAAAIEEHTNIPGTNLIGKPHKGISMFVENS